MSHSITIREAIKMTSLYRQHRETILESQNRGQDILPLSETFSRQAIEALLAQPGCTALRLYYGMDDALKVHAVIVASNDQNQDILPQNKDDEAGDDSIVDRGLRCPPLCPEPSPLNEP